MHDQAVLQTFGRALDREAHNLARWPELVWQQLYNRLQWKEPAPGPLVEEFSRRSAQAGSAWMRLRSPYREAGGLLRTLEGHTQEVHCCALAPDGSYLVSGSEDSRLKIWDTSTGTERATLEGHARDVLGCAFAPDGSLIVSASRDNTLKLWDPTTARDRIWPDHRHRRRVGQESGAPLSRLQDDVSGEG
jgi:WD40 repeat protein